MAALGAFGAWCVLAAFVARACVPRSLDLRVYRDAASLMVHGGAPYAVTFTAQHFPFTYPPFALYVLSPLSMIGVRAAIWWLDGLGCLALLVAIAICVRHVAAWTWPRALVLGALLAPLSCLALEPVRSTLIDGQVNLLLLLAVVLDLLVVPRRFRGVLVGLVGAVKLTPLVFVVYLALSGDRRAVVRALGTFGLATAVAWLARPVNSTTFWFHQAFSPSRKGASRSTANQSWWGLVGRLPATEGWVRMAVWLGLCVATLCVGAFVAHRCLRRRHHLDAMLAIAVTGVLVSPISWTHHWSFVALVPVALCWPVPRALVVRLALSLLLAVAVVAPYGWHVQGSGSGWPGFSLLGAGALLLATMAVTEWRRGRVTAAERREVALVAAPALRDGSPR
jgi:alpha-1,2-mannosyltransferase